MMKFSLCLLMFTAIFWQNSYAEQKISKGQYELHFNTFPSTFLDKKTATTHQIKRSKSRGIISITLMDTSKTPAVAVEGQVTIEAKNLFGQIKTMEIKTIKENQTGIYYLGLFRMNNEENIQFTMAAKPSGSTQTLSHKITREFFTD